MALYPVVLAGGEGTRLWPLSKKSHPKQFLDPLNEGSSLFQQAVLRACKLSSLEPIVVANKAHRFLIAKQLKEIGLSHLEILLEPSSKNTASAVLASALWLATTQPGDHMAVFPCDHYVEDDREFISAVLSLSDSLGVKDLGLIGIKPNRPATEYGYLKTDCKGAVSEFIEKPDSDLALTLIDQQGVFWNSGVVVSSANLIIDLCRIQQPKLAASVEVAVKESVDFYGFQLLGDSYRSIDPVSFDVAVLEKAKAIKCAIYTGDWDDLGGWESLINRRLKNELPLVFSSKARPFTSVEKDILVIEDEDVLLVVNKGSVNDISLAIHELKKRGRHDLLAGLETVRPWGEFKVLTSAPGYLVKHLCIVSGGSISLQSHSSRIEHWVVVSGVGSAELNGNMIALNKGDALTIKAGEVHRLTNDSNEALAVIEIQIGDHLSESDIVRYDDQYQRHLS
jgi:mannose-1-phosphate guanylyltransferase/mannose-1-phosphate guanylyltransferase/mannose-6-phosphate isomerase